MNYNALCVTTLNDKVATKSILCDVTGEEYRVTVPLGQFLLFRAGELAQNAFPDLSAEEREFMITGITPAKWDSIFKD